MRRVPRRIQFSRFEGLLGNSVVRRPWRRSPFTAWILGPLLSAVFACLVSRAEAHETDQYSVPMGREFADLRFYFSNDVRRIILRGMERTNSRIRQAIKRGAPASEVVRLQSPEAVARAVWGGFPPVFNHIESIDATLLGSKMKRKYPGLVVAYRPWIWIYHHPALLLDITKAVRLGRCSTVMVNGVYFGTDKIAHFVHMGIIYYNGYRAAKAAGVDEQEAVRRAVDLGAGGHPLFSENALLGLFTTGVRSNADLAANYLGFKFFRNLTEHEKLRGQVRPPLLVRQGAEWRLNHHVAENSDWFTIFVTDHWNEALNPNAYGPGVGPCVCEGIRARCESILAWYPEEYGQRRTRQDFLRTAETLSTYYGESYGYQGVPAELTGVASCCFDRVAEESPTDAPAPADGTPRLASRNEPAGVEVDSWTRPSRRNFSGDDGLSPPLNIWDAIRLGEVGISSRLFSEAGVPKPCDRDGDSPLHHAVRWGRIEVARNLIRLGHDVNIRGLYGATPLHLALRESSEEMANLLLEHRAQLDLRDEFGCTPLHDAAGRAEPNAITLLLDAGANPNGRDAYGNSPLHLAARAGRLDAVELLLEAGAQPGTPNELGKTPADFATAGGHREIARRLRSAARFEGEGRAVRLRSSPAN